MSAFHTIWPLICAANGKNPRRDAARYAMLALEAHQHRWYRTDDTAAQDAAQYIIENAGNLAATPLCGKQTMALLHRYAASVTASQI